MYILISVCWPCALQNNVRGGGGRRGDALEQGKSLLTPAAACLAILRDSVGAVFRVFRVFRVSQLAFVAFPAASSKPFVWGGIRRDPGCSTSMSLQRRIFMFRIPSRHLEYQASD